MIDQDSKNFIEALKTGDRELMMKVPKGDVHNHIALGGDFDSWVRKEGLDLKKVSGPFHNFDGFQKFIDQIFTYPYTEPTNKQSIDRLLSLFNASYELATKDGVTYIEPGYDCHLLSMFDMDLERMIKVLSDQIDQFKGKIKVAPDLGIIRVFDFKDIEATTLPCIESGFFKGLDIYADENMGAPEHFVSLFKAAKKAGMKLKAHAGEYLDADFVRKSVELLDLDEVQHGIAAATSLDVMKFLAERGTRLNVCPTSNILLCRTESYKTHPLRILIDNGIKVTINSDDAIIFGKTVSEEFFSLYETGLYSATELNEIRLNAFPEGDVGS